MRLIEIFFLAENARFFQYYVRILASKIGDNLILYGTLCNLGLGWVRTLSGPNSAARTSQRAERRGQTRLSPSLFCNSTRHARNFFKASASRICRCRMWPGFYLLIHWCITLILSEQVLFHVHKVSDKKYNILNLKKI